MKNIKFFTTPDDEWLVNGNIIMYRCQNGSLYDDDIEWRDSSIAEAVEAMLDPSYPRLPQQQINQLLETELGSLINHFQQGKLVFVPISMFEKWKEKISQTHDKLIELGELPDGLAVQEENKNHVCWDLYLEIFCQQAAIPAHCWVQIEKCGGGYELIEVVNRKPQYKSKSTLGKGIQFSKFFEVLG